MSAYNEIPYPGHSYPETHPDTLVRNALLFGLRPQAVDCCRVLEIGCGDGANLIPMAFELPNSEFVGIDLATTPIQVAKRVIQDTGARNITVSATDLMDVGRDFGTFDYIIAHGFYSWVPQQVQEKLFQVCDENLRSNGLAFISFNTYPDGHIRRATRDMMLYHLLASGSPADPRRGRDFLKVMMESADDKGFWKAALREEVERLAKRQDNVIFHDELSPNYSASYFADFAAAAQRHGLQFLSEVTLADAIGDSLKPETTKTIERLANGNQVAYQQYLDFVTFRGFRRTIICHQDAQLDRDHVTANLRRLFVASPLVKSAEKGSGAVTFTNRHGPGTITTTSPVLATALTRLQANWPRGILFTDLADEIRAHVPSHLKDELGTVLPGGLLKLAVSKVIDFRSYQPPIAESIHACPSTTALIRLQAAQSRNITTLLHREIEIADPEPRRLLQLLDGTQDVKSLSSLLDPNGSRTSRATSERDIRSMLGDFREMGLLISETRN
jgi:methyltransferase-like protein